MARWTLLVGVVLAGCGPEAVPDDEDTDGCAADASELRLGQDVVGEGAHAVGEPLNYGRPPQGGAPYLPIQLMLRGPVAEGVPRWLTEASVAEGGVVLGSLAQSQAWLCSNTGPIEGWRYGGEVHLRFDGRSLEELEGVEVEVVIDVALPDGGVAHASTTGALAWTLGR